MIIINITRERYQLLVIYHTTRLYQLLTRGLVVHCHRIGSLTLMINNMIKMIGLIFMKAKFFLLFSISCDSLT